MSSMVFLRAAGRAAWRRPPPRSPTGALAAATAGACLARRLRPVAAGAASPFSTSAARRKGQYSDETFEEFNTRFEKEFEMVNDVFELQRNLNNAFSYDLVPTPEVLKAALHAARRVNDFPTAVRIFEAIKAKVENNQQYHAYLEELKSLREELGVVLAEDLYPEFVPKGR